MRALDDVHVGPIGALAVDWRLHPEPETDDDELLDPTPVDVVALLGFDPLDEVRKYNPDQERGP